MRRLSTVSVLSILLLASCATSRPASIEVCDCQRAVCVVKGISKWKPAIYKGKAVNVQYCIPINFKLQ